MQSKNYLWRKVTFDNFNNNNKKSNTLPQVFLRLLMRLIIPNCKKHYILCLFSSNKRVFYCKNIFLFITPILYLEIKIIGVKNFRHKCYISPLTPPVLVYTSTQKCLQRCINILVFISGVLWYLKFIYTMV